MKIKLAKIGTYLLTGAASVLAFGALNGALDTDFAPAPEAQAATIVVNTGSSELPINVPDFITPEFADLSSAVVKQFMPPAPAAVAPEANPPAQTTPPAQVAQPNHSLTQAPVEVDNYIFDQVNRERAAYGLAPLYWDDGMVGHTRNWSATQAYNESMFHDYSFDGYDGENVAMGPMGNEWSVVDRYMASPSHRDNVLRPEYRRMANITVYNHATGTYHQTMRFGY